jgi:hypothetical protein
MALSPAQNAYPLMPTSPPARLRCITSARSRPTHPFEWPIQRRRSVRVQNCQEEGPQVSGRRSNRRRTAGKRTAYAADLRKKGSAKAEAPAAE